MQSLSDYLHDKYKKQTFKKAEAVLRSEHLEMKEKMKCYENYNFLELNEFLNVKNIYLLTDYKCFMLPS